ncbi:macrophage mannose receptor 1-like [Physella acuta]|uniref:macrophage mannose receptor 1-like n=1 Tax=Physella acuta TaxID=109671 RepID=UPI0027DCE786|nr:macrophage mannose receptor 1-like [Physella acuta]
MSLRQAAPAAPSPCARLGVFYYMSLRQAAPAPPTTCISKTATEFDNNCYEFITTRMTLIEAQKYCSNFNGTRILAKVSSPSVLDFLNSLRKNNEFVWLGANDTLHNGEWVWTDGTKANLTSMWNNGEPNNEGGIEHCLQIYNNGKLNDMPCNETIYTAFICMEVHETTASPKTSPTTYPTSTATLSFTTARNESKFNNVSSDSLECISNTATMFDNNCYELFTNEMSWNEAKRYCSNFNGTRILAKVSSPSVLRYLNSLRPSYTRVWLGGNDQLQEGKWVWTDGTKANLTTMWGYGEPNNLDGNQDCLEIVVDGTLNDYDCAQTFSFICMEVHETTATPETYPTTYPTTTATPSFTTARNESKVKNVSSDSLECFSKTATMFDNNCYELFTTAKNWTEANRYCSNFNGTRILAKVSSPSVLRYFISIIQSGTRVWLGASDQLQEGEWVWTDGTMANLTSMWNKREPNDKFGNEDCLEILGYGTRQTQIQKLTQQRIRHYEQPPQHLALLQREMFQRQPRVSAKRLRYLTTTAMSYSQHQRIGLKRRPSNIREGEWMWTDGTEANLTSLWHVNEPNDQEGNEDCLELYDYGMLNDDDCAKTFSFICMELHEIIATPETYPTTYQPTTATPSITTARNKFKNDSSDSLEKMYSFGQTEWIGIVTSFCILVMCLLLAVLLAIKYRCEIWSLSGKLKEFGYTTINENQIRYTTINENQISKIIAHKINVDFKSSYIRYIT